MPEIITDVGNKNAWLQIADETTGPRASQAGNDGTFATFYWHQKQNERKSEEEGRPIFDEVPYVIIRLAGQKNTEVIRAVKEEDKTRWPEAWARFEQRQSGLVGGMPLSEWAYLTRTRVAELNASGVFSVEQLAGLPEANAATLGPDGYDLMKRAQQHLQPDNETISQLRAENKSLQDRLAALEARFSTAQKIAPETVQLRPAEPQNAGPAPAIVPEEFPGKAAANPNSPRNAPFRVRRIYQGFGVVDASDDSVVAKFSKKLEAEADCERRLIEIGWGGLEQ